MTQLIPRLWLAIASVLTAQLAFADSCPPQIFGGWESRLPVAALFDVSIELERRADGEFAARLHTSRAAEELGASLDGKSLRVRSERLGLAFDGRLSADGTAIDGFVEFASNLYRVTLRAAGKDRWSGHWSPLPQAGEAAVLELYFDDEGDGVTGGYFFFRDERLPGLYGLGASCAGRRVEVREKNLGLVVTGDFSEDYAALQASVSALGVFTRTPTSGRGWTRERSHSRTRDSNSHNRCKALLIITPALIESQVRSRNTDLRNSSS